MFSRPRPPETSAPSPLPDGFPSPASALAALRAHEAEIAGRALSLDHHGAFPTDDIALLREIGVLAAFGADGATADELFEALRVVGRCNLSLGRIFEGHVNGARLVTWYGSDEQRRQLRQDLADGRVYGVWSSEPSPGVAISHDAQPVLIGRKHYATGAGLIDKAIVTARTESAERWMLVADASDLRRADNAAWRVRGMKATQSGSYDLTGLPAGAKTRLGLPGDYEREPRFSAGAWRFTAVQLGGVERILCLLRQYSVTSEASSAPIRRARFGEALAAARTAWLWVREAARMAEDGLGAASDDIVAMVLMTRGVVEHAGLEVMEAAARIIGTRAFFDDEPIDMAVRDLSLYLRQPVPDQARDRAAASFLQRDAWPRDRLW
jgi:alkylation response protein AidB-like acyl-CoA dehydrogenase